MAVILSYFGILFPISNNQARSKNQNYDFPSGYCVAEQDTPTSCCFVVFWNSDSNTWIDISTNKLEVIIISLFPSGYCVAERDTTTTTTCTSEEDVTHYHAYTQVRRVVMVSFMVVLASLLLCCGDGDRGDGHDAVDGDGGHDGSVVDE